MSTDMGGTRRLEIGAGGGLVGLAVARGCNVKQPLYITDQLEMLELMGHNIVLNEAGNSVKAMILNWFVPHRLIFPRDAPLLRLEQMPGAVIYR